MITGTDSSTPPRPQGQLRGRLGADPDLPMEFGKGIMQSFMSRFR
jgi:hypothetical protein